jgi:hypothetical protein
MATKTNPWDVKTRRAEFESFTEFLDFVNDESIEGMTPLEQQVSRASANDKVRRDFQNAHWHGTPTWEAAMELALKGWPEGVTKLEKIRAPMIEKLMPVILKPEIQYELVGTGGLDMGRVMSGMPDPFMEWQDSETPVFGSGRQLVRIVLNCAVSAGVDSDVIVSRGAAVAALVDALEAAGRRVSVVIAEAVSNFNRGENVTIMLLLKRPDAPLSIDTLTFAFAHPSMLRRLMFAAQERLPDADIRRDYGFQRGGYYGMPTDLKPEEHGDIYLGAMRYGDPNFNSPEAARTWVLETLKAQGVIFDENEMKRK